MCMFVYATCVCVYMRCVSKYAGTVRTRHLSFYHKTVLRGREGVKATNLSLFHPHQHLLCAAHTHTIHTAKAFPGLQIRQENESMTWTPSVTIAVCIIHLCLCVFVALAELLRSFP